MPIISGMAKNRNISIGCVLHVFLVRLYNYCSLWSKFSLGAYPQTSQALKCFACCTITHYQSLTLQVIVFKFSFLKYAPGPYIILRASLLVRHCQVKCITKSHLILLVRTRTDIKLLSSGCSNINKAICSWLASYNVLEQNKAITNNMAYGKYCIHCLQFYFSLFPSCCFIKLIVVIFSCNYIHIILCS